MTGTTVCDGLIVILLQLRPNVRPTVLKVPLMLPICIPSFERHLLYNNLQSLNTLLQDDCSVLLRDGYWIR